VTDRSGPGLRSLLGLAVLSAGCGSPIITLRPVPSGAQAISFLGDTLWAAPIEPGAGPSPVRQLHAAQRNLQAKPTDPAARMLVARRTAALGRLREAVDLYTEIIAEDRGTARLYRRRGEMLLLLREVDLAERDLRRAVKSPAARIEKEFVEDADGRLVQTSLGYQAHLLLGVVQYVRGEHQRAATSLLEAIRYSTGADELVQGGLWLGMALFRAGRGAEALEVIRGIPGDLEVTERVAELTLLRLFRGEVRVDSLRVLANQGRDAEALYLYGLGVIQLVRGEPAIAAELFEEILRLGRWHTWPAIAAESELPRLRPRATLR
jgi:tetratricopeptide (TPR) repeat protein